jgi:hypothetical protein
MRDAAGSRLNRGQKDPLLQPCGSFFLHAAQHTLGLNEFRRAKTTRNSTPSCKRSGPLSRDHSRRDRLGSEQRPLILNPTAANETGPIPPAPALATPSTPSILPPARVHDFNKRLPI